MPLSCVAYNCTNRFRKGVGISFHRFPFRDKKLLAEWVKAVCREKWQPTPTSYLCSHHFEDKWFYHLNGQRKLLNLAVPTLFDYTDHRRSLRSRKRKRSSLLSENCGNSSAEHQRKETPKKLREIRPLIKEKTISSDLNTNSCLLHSKLTPSANTRASKKLSQSLAEQIQSSQESGPTDGVVYSTDSPLYIFTDALGLSHTKPQGDKQSIVVPPVSDKESKVHDFGSIFPELKSMMRSEQGSFIIEKCFSDVIKDIIKDPHQKVAEYSKSVKRLASTIHFYSMKAYEYLRLFAKLPHPSTLFHWATVSGGKPGFTDESFLQLSKQVKSVQSIIDYHGQRGKIICCLVVDEMQIKKQLDFDGKEIVGYCDLGHGDLSDDEVPVAKEALVFVATTINRNWKMPLGYCLIDGLEGSVRANLVKLYLLKLHEIGVDCVAVACDGTGRNLSMFRELGVEFNAKSRKNWFVHPSDSERKVYSFFDAAQMIKALRNLIGERGVIIDSSKENDNDRIEWRYFNNLHNLQECLREEASHIRDERKSVVQDNINLENNPPSYKERYGLTEEMLSTSVSLALQFCENLNMDQFLGSSTTAEFASRIDDIFDLLTSNYIFACGSKSPIMKKNKAAILNCIGDAINYLEGLKEPGPENPTPIINGPRKTGVLGLIFNLMSVRDLAEELVWAYISPLMGLLTEKLSQGNLESLFHSIRKNAGDIQSPTAVEFRSAYRKCVIQGACVTHKAAAWRKTMS